MLNRLEPLVAQFTKRELAPRAINLPLLFFKLGKIASGKIGICRTKATADFLAVDLDPGIVSLILGRFS